MKIGLEDLNPPNNLALSGLSITTLSRCRAVACRPQAEKPICSRFLSYQSVFALHFSRINVHHRCFPLLFEVTCL